MSDRPSRTIKRDPAKRERGLRGGPCAQVLVKLRALQPAAAAPAPAHEGVPRVAAAAECVICMDRGVDAVAGCGHEFCGA